VDTGCVLPPRFDLETFARSRGTGRLCPTGKHLRTGHHPRTPHPKASPRDTARGPSRRAATDRLTGFDLGRPPRAAGYSRRTHLLSPRVKKKKYCQSIATGPDSATIHLLPCASVDVDHEGRFAVKYSPACNHIGGFTRMPFGTATWPRHGCTATPSTDEPSPASPGVCTQTLPSEVNHARGRAGKTVGAVRDGHHQPGSHSRGHVSST